MISTVNHTPAAIELRPQTRMSIWLPIAFFSVLWIDLVRQLSFHWESSEQYAYGWFVPFLSLALFWKRWVTRSAPQVHPSPKWLAGAVAILGVSLLPIRIIYEINPDWALPGWLMSGAIILLSLYAVFLMGGWNWVRHFAFPICFILVAVQWPYRIEHALTQGLMRVVAAFTVELLGWFDVMAFQRGNLIEVSTGMVGINEACSGIRSFQSTLMVALFLGELYRLKFAGRILLLVGGIAVAFCLNVARTSVLTWQASSHGPSAVEKWHDPAGMMIFLTSFAAIWVLALWSRRKAGRKHQISEETRPAASFFPRTLPRRYLGMVGCWGIAVLVLTELWYRAHESKSTGGFYWSASFPTNKPSFEEIELNETARKILRHDIGATGKWKEDDGTEWIGFFLRWNPGPVRSIIAARLHRPDICLPASGHRQVADAGSAYFEARELELPFRRYIYEMEGRTIHVFFCQWEDGAENQIGMMASKGWDRIRAALVGRRHLGQQSLELIVSGYGSLIEAEEAVRKHLPSLIVGEVSMARSRQETITAKNDPN